MLEKRKASDAFGYIVSIEGNKTIIEMDESIHGIGQKVSAIVSAKENTSKGKPVIVSDVVAQGKIVGIDGRQITICSSQYNPIISPKAAMEALKHSIKIKVKAIP